MPRLTVASPLGPLTLVAHGDALVAVLWDGPPGGDENVLLVTAAAQLDEYFAGRRRAFDLPLAPAGTPFQRRVWRALMDIPFGQTSTYGDVAEDVASGPRPVGGAVGRNPLPIMVPCHRVVAAGAPGGYSGPGGLATKRFLLRLEGAWPPAAGRR